ncbi:LRR receptor-like serine/threonine-protein kinase EFR [Rosa chinensis]|uniref:LRR receptor-like serine/threonine-protein kinase EFR n=1 Tax=Rosa chinensis TaxID=74649 RepID=UPI001AD8ECFF|nr:LRR receptor-like serine/threonine-protein kinase EFR [Rosa chinensis]
MEKPKVLLYGVLLLQFLCSLHFAVSSANSNFTDQSALLAIQSKLTFDPTKTVLGGNWTTTTSFCNWIGVSCSKQRQRVTALNLSYMGLQGTIFPHVGNLSSLVSLDLRNNSFIGLLPHEISRLPRLRILVLQENELEGNIPPTLYQCRQLEIISLAANRLNGLIPKELGLLPRLQQLYLAKNSLMSGEIPSSLGNISTLKRLSLDQCGLTGSFPSALLNLSSLVAISLYDKNISGFLPIDICDNHWPNVQIFSVSYNKFSGLIPSWIHQCAQLVTLSLSYNSLVGSIPREIGSLQYLEELYLDGNNLTGTIPPTIGEIPSGGLFSNLTAKSFLANKGLCGRPDFGVPPCLSHNTQKSKTPLNRLTYILPVIASTIILPAVIYMLAKNQKRNAEIPRSDTNLMAEEHRFISYNDLCRATNDFCESNSLGVGGFGSMYKGILFDGTTVAIKVLNLQREGGL